MRQPAQKTLHLLVTCCKEPVRFEILEKVIEQLREEGLSKKRLESVEEMLRISFDPTSNGWLIEQGLETLRALEEQKELLLDRIAKHIDADPFRSGKSRHLLSSHSPSQIASRPIHRFLSERGPPQPPVIIPKDT